MVVEYGNQERLKNTAMRWWEQFKITIWKCSSCRNVRARCSGIAPEWEFQPKKHQFIAEMGLDRLLAVRTGWSVWIGRSVIQLSKYLMKRRSWSARVGGFWGMDLVCARSVAFLLAYVSTWGGSIVVLIVVRVSMTWGTPLSFAGWCYGMLKTWISISRCWPCPSMCATQ